MKQTPGDGLMRAELELCHPSFPIGSMRAGRTKHKVPWLVVTCSDPCPILDAIVAQVAMAE